MRPDTSPDTASPRLVIDLDTVVARFRGMRDTLDATLPGSAIRYAVKANPAFEVLRLLTALGSGFDVASPGEVELCLAAGADPARLSYGNPIKKPADIAFAHRAGVPVFTTDSEGDLDALARHAPGSRVLCRLHVDAPGADTPFGDKFGCDEATAVGLLRRAAGRGLRPHGVTFHVGSQHRRPDAWHTGVAAAARVTRKLAAEGVALPVLDIGGGFPAGYRDPAPPLSEYTDAVRTALAAHFPAPAPRILLEPGRSLVAEAGVLHTEVVAVRSHPGDPRRWIYLDAGRYNGLAETENEAIAYRLRTPHDGGPAGPVVLAGPTCDGDDVLYRHTPYELPLALAAGDPVEVLAAGAYTASYASVGFNGFPPLPTHCVRGGTAGESSSSQQGNHPRTPRRG